LVLQSLRRFFKAAAEFPPLQSLLPLLCFDAGGRSLPPTGDGAKWAKKFPIAREMGEKNAY
jgi:hypothetical protein